MTQTTPPAGPGLSCWAQPGEQPSPPYCPAPGTLGPTLGGLAQLSLPCSLLKEVTPASAPPLAFSPIPHAALARVTLPGRQQVSDRWGWGLRNPGFGGAGLPAAACLPTQRSAKWLPCLLSHSPASALFPASMFPLCEAPLLPGVLRTPQKCDPRKHPEADVAATFHPGLILNCAVFLSKLSGHLPSPGNR